MNSATALIEAPAPSGISGATLSTPPDDQAGAMAELDWISPTLPSVESSIGGEGQSDIGSFGQPMGLSAIVAAATELEHETHEFRAEQSLRPEISQEARQWLNGDLVIIHQRAMLFCTEEARRMHISISRLQLSVKRSWEGEFNELVLRVFVEGNLPQSLALWDAIGDAIQRWGKKQHPRRARLLNEQYAVFVEPLNQR